MSGTNEPSGSAEWLLNGNGPPGEENSLAGRNMNTQLYSSSRKTWSWSSLYRQLQLWLWGWFHVAWIYFFKWLAHPIFSPRPSSDRFIHHILVAGDDWALGYGDNGFPGTDAPGVPRYLKAFLSRSPSIRHTWRVLNFGRRASRTDDWLPPEVSKQHTKGKLFSELLQFSGPRHVVVLLVGFHDKCSAAETFQNLRDTATALSLLFGYVYLSTLPDTTAHGDALPACNQLLKLWIQSLPKSSNIRLGAEIDRTNREYSLARLYAKDKIHFNKHGYIKMAKDLSLAMEHDCRKLEFHEEKNFLQ